MDEVLENSLIYIIKEHYILHGCVVAYKDMFCIGGEF